MGEARVVQKTLALQFAKFKSHVACFCKSKKPIQVAVCSGVGAHVACECMGASTSHSMLVRWVAYRLRVYQGYKAHKVL